MHKRIKLLVTALAVTTVALAGSRTRNYSV
jgi:hypothetical protein